MRRLRFALFSLGAVALAASLSAQAPAGAPAPGQARGGGAPQPPPQNLQVLPKDIPRPELIAMMGQFRQALGVECSYCHVAEGRGGRNDYAADDKAPKKTARLMIQMVDHVNEMIASGIGKPAADITKVQCATCHRGAAIPKVEMPAAPAQQTPGR
jgi:hypothetical protein